MLIALHLVMKARFGFDRPSGPDCWKLRLSPRTAYRPVRAALQRLVAYRYKRRWDLGLGHVDTSNQFVQEAESGGLLTLSVCDDCCSLVQQLVRRAK